MRRSDTATSVMPFLERALDNRYAQENLSDAAENLRAAYRRASKRRVEPTRDKKLREQLRQAALSITEAGSAIKTGRQKPRKRWGRRVRNDIAVEAAVLGIELAPDSQASDRWALASGGEYYGVGAGVGISGFRADLWPRRRLLRQSRGRLQGRVRG